MMKKYEKKQAKISNIIVTRKIKTNKRMDAPKIEMKFSPSIEDEHLHKKSIIKEMERLRNEINTEKTGYRVNHRKNILDAYKTTILLKQDASMRWELETDPEWEKFSAKGRTKKSPSSLLITVLNYLFGNETRLQRKKTSKIKRALEPYFLLDISPTTVRDPLMKGGLPNLIKNQPLIEGAATQTKRPPKKPPEQSITFILQTDKFYEDIKDLDKGTFINAKLKITKKIARKIFIKIVSLKETDN